MGDDNENLGVEEEAATLPETEQHVDDSQGNNIPVHVVQSIREELQEIKRQNRYLEQQLQTRHSASDEEDEEEDIDDDTPITGADLKRIRQRDQERFNAMMVNQERSFSLKQQVKEAKESFQDYDQVVKTYLPEMLRSKSWAQQAIESADNPALEAYEIAKMHPNYRAKKPSQEEKAEKIIKNASYPKAATRSSTVSQRVVSPQSVKDMSRDDFLKYAYSVRGT
jgi:hypothetical protein